MTILSAHQPNFIPWAGYFLKIIQSDIFIFSDDVDYCKQQNTNRVLFLTQENEDFLFSIPVERKKGTRIFEKVLSQNKEKMVEKSIRRLLMMYKQSPFFDEFVLTLNEIKEIILNKNMLADCNISIIQLICSKLEISLKYKLGSDLGLQEYKANERLLFRAKSLGIMNYLHGKGAKGYQDDNYLEKNGMQLKTVDTGRLEIFKYHYKYSILHLIAYYGIDRISEVLNH